MTRARAAELVAINGPALRALRVAAGLSLGQLAPKIGCAVGHLSRVELGVRRSVRTEIFEALVRELQVDGRALLVDPYGTRAAQDTQSLTPLWPHNGPDVVGSDCKASTAVA